MSHQSSPPPLHPQFGHGGGHMQHPHQAYAPSMNGAHLQLSQQAPGHAHPQYHQIAYTTGPPLATGAMLVGHGQSAGLLPQRWPIPPAQPMDARHLSGGRHHKKEAKKRTKTGCLTCRKRRIKCGEERPDCRNCLKSKRECLGYEHPKEARGSSPANIQPAPLGTTASARNLAPVPSQQQSHFHQPSPFGVSGGSSEPGTTSQSPDTSFGTGRNDYDSPFASSMARGANLNALLPQRKVKYIDIEDLFSLDNIPPKFDVRESPPTLHQQAQQLVENFFNYHYMGALDKFFETTWYSANGLAHIRKHPILNDFVFQVANRMRDQVEANGAKYATSLEARLVWKLAIMPRDAALSGIDDAIVGELVPRIDAVEKLFTGQFLDPGRVPPPPPLKPDQVVFGSTSGSDHDSAHQTLLFWHHLCRFASLRDDVADPTAMEEIDGELLTIRNLLEQLETRDVLYSVAILRFIGGRTRDFHPQRHIVASTNNAEENTSKLKVAQTFLDREAAHGTDQVTQRMCAMAMRGLGLWKQR